MPQAKEKSSTDLSIELQDGCSFYTPGSKVSGVVTLRTIEDFAIGSVNIEFYGRAKVYFVYSHGQGESIHRGRAPLFSQKQVLYEGIHTHKAGVFEWPFAFELPTSPNVAVVREAKHLWNEKDHFLSTDDYIPSHPMPPTWKMWKWGFGYRWHAFIEYVLRVDVAEAPGARMVLPAESRKAIMPITVKDIAMPDPDTMSLPLSVQFTLPEQMTEKTRLNGATAGRPTLQSWVNRQTVRSSRLLDWNRNKIPSPFTLSDSIRDKTKSIFMSDSLPRYTFDLTVTVPEQIRLLEEGAFPIKVSAVAVRENEFTTIALDNCPDIRIDNLSLELCASTYIRFKSIFPSNQKTRHDIKLIDKQPVGHTIDMSKHQLQDHSSKLDKSRSNDDTSDGFDLSKLPGLAPALTSAKMGRNVENPLTPSFHTYIISREYTLGWKLELDVAGEKLKVTNDDQIPVLVLPPDGEKLQAFMQNTDVTKVDVDGDEGAGECDEVETKKTSGKKAILNKFGRKSKQQEAAEEAAATVEADTAITSNDGTQQFSAAEALPAYERQPTTSLVYRNEIDEQPPRYETQ